MIALLKQNRISELTKLETITYYLRINHSSLVIESTGTTGYDGIAGWLKVVKGADDL